MIFKIGLILVLGAICAVGSTLEGAASTQSASAIVAAARSKIGTPYVWGGGDKNGPTKGGFDCSGLSLYSVYQGTGRGKLIPRVSRDQYTFKGCAAIKLADRLPGDLIFWGNAQGVYHVAIVSAKNKVIHAPKPGKKVEEVNLFTTSQLMPIVRRCW